MDSTTRSLVAAWRAAADDLGISIQAPFSLHLSGRIITADVLVRSFGQVNGMLVCARAGVFDDVFHDVSNEIVAAGYGYSVLGSSYESYDRDLFVETLRDWSWSGPDCDCPDWCSQ
jgi:hypothetical protein